jgi:hypothetical protein
MQALANGTMSFARFRPWLSYMSGQKPTMEAKERQLQQKQVELKTEEAREPNATAKARIKEEERRVQGQISDLGSFLMLVFVLQLIAPLFMDGARPFSSLYTGLTACTEAAIREKQAAGASRPEFRQLLHSDADKILLELVETLNERGITLPGHQGVHLGRPSTQVDALVATAVRKTLQREESSVCDAERRLRIDVPALFRTPKDLFSGASVPDFGKGSLEAGALRAYEIAQAAASNLAGIYSRWIREHGSGYDKTHLLGMAREVQQESLLADALALGACFVIRNRS